MKLLYPLVPDKMPIETDIIAVFLKPFPNIMAVMFGITINDDISSTPTNRIDVMTTMLASTMKM